VPAFAGSLSAGDKPMIVAEDVRTKETIELWKFIKSLR
jgi:hypothetical protein